MYDLKTKERRNIRTYWTIVGSLILGGLVLIFIPNKKEIRTSEKLIPTIEISPKGDTTYIYKI